YSGQGPNCNAGLGVRAAPLGGPLSAPDGACRPAGLPLRVRCNQPATSQSMAKRNSPAKTPQQPDALTRIAAALERLSPVATTSPDFDAADAFAWHPDGRRLTPVPKVNRVEMALLKGIDRVRDVLVENTDRFARGLPAN